VLACLPDDVPDDVQFDGIWSNPPIRVGKHALHDLLQRWLPRLAPNAAATLVVHKHLGADSLAQWLQDEGWAAERQSSRAGYRLLRVARQ
jgi:16S rRNA G1207 methylase RsmC